MGINIFIFVAFISCSLSRSIYIFCCVCNRRASSNGIMERMSFVDATVYKSVVSERDLSYRRSTLPGEYKSAKLEWYSGWASVMPI